jgi:hypothetical protein
MTFQTENFGLYPTESEKQDKVNLDNQPKSLAVVKPSPAPEKRNKETERWAKTLIEIAEEKESLNQVLSEREIQLLKTIQKQRIRIRDLIRIITELKSSDSQ